MNMFLSQGELQQGRKGSTIQMSHKDGDFDVGSTLKIDIPAET